MPTPQEGRVCWLEIFSRLFAKFYVSQKKSSLLLRGSLNFPPSLLGKGGRGVRSLCLCVLFFFFLSTPNVLAQPQLERTPLTLEILEQRLHSPIINEGSLTVDLRQMVIDLRPDNAVFRDAFYQLLRKELQKTGVKPLGLDLSNSLIQGDLIGSDLGLRTPLFSQAITPIFTPIEQQQLERLRFVCLSSVAVDSPTPKDCRSLLGNQLGNQLGNKSNSSSDTNVFRGSLTMMQTRFSGNVQFANTFFLQPINAQGAIFNSATTWNEARFSRPVTFNNAVFRKESNYLGSIFFEQVDFKQTQFQDAVYFQGSTFIDTANFTQAVFKQLAKFNRVQCLENANFSGVRFANQAQFTKANFNKFLFLMETTFEQAVTFREAQFSQSVNLRGASILNQADFSDTSFAKEAFLNVAGLGFNSNQAKILGNPGEIGKHLCVPTLQGNQNVLRNLVQNFRQQQQIADANQIEYKKQRLRLLELYHRLFAININLASEEKLQSLGFSTVQAAAIARHRIRQLFRSGSDLLSIPEVDLEIYKQVAPLLVFDEPLSVGGWLLQALRWLGLSILLLLSGYGTNVWLVVGVGEITIAYFGLVYWLVDRFRRLRPVAIVPTGDETFWMLTSFTFFVLLGLISIFRESEQPWLSLGCVCIIIFPVSMSLLFRMYEEGRFHDLMDVSYFTAEGTLRQVRLLIGRLPVIPNYPAFRERYIPLLWERHWNWLNYYDFSLNNLIKLGFNDIRLRDEHLPGIISALAWYQWCLGILYITLLLWTLSRTIPGLNLLIYLK